jgi:hypothetical protein
LAAVTIHNLAGSKRFTRKCVVKVCPPGPYVRESAKHHEAIDRSPAAFVRDHLVDVVFDPIRCPDGTVLLGQDIAGGSLARCQPMSKLTGDEMVASCRAVVPALLTGWTGEDYGTSGSVSIARLLRHELRDSFAPGGWVRSWGESVGLLDTSSAWIETPEDGVLPNPILMAVEQSHTTSCLVQYLTGRTHGDLHDDNVLIPRSPDGRLEPEQFRLIDLATFEYDAPLSRDLAALLLSIVSQVAGELPTRQQNALLEYLLTLNALILPDLPPNLVDQVKALRDVGEAPFMARGFHDNWDVQFLVSMQAAALLHVTYESIGERGRWWCFRLAAHAAKHILTRYGRYQPGRPRSVDPRILAVTSASPAPSGPTERPEVASRSLSLTQRMEIVDRLLTIPGMTDPSLRQRLYDDLPTEVVQHVHRDSAARQELFDLVHAFEEYHGFDPWGQLIRVLRARFPHHPTVHDLAAVLVSHGRIGAEDI